MKLHSNHYELVYTAAYARSRKCMLRSHSPDASTSAWNEVMAAILKCDVKSKKQTLSIDAYLKNIPAKYHIDPIWNHGASGYFWRGRPNKKHKNQEKDE